MAKGLALTSSRTPHKRPVTRQPELSRDTPCTCALPLDGLFRILAPSSSQFLEIEPFPFSSLFEKWCLGLARRRRKKSEVPRVVPHHPSASKGGAGEGAGSARAQSGPRGAGAEATVSGARVGV